MTTIHLIADSQERYEVITERLRDLEIYAIQRSMQNRVNEAFSAQFGEEGKASSHFGQAVSGRSPESISLREAERMYEETARSSLASPSRLMPRPDIVLGTVIEEKIRSCMTPFEIVDHFSGPDFPTFAKVTGGHTVTLYTSLAAAAHFLGRQSVMDALDFDNKG